jgi:rRNA maturation RNase YbeY
MPMPGIRYFSEQIRFSLPHPRKTRHWIKRVVGLEKATPGEINYVFCPDQYLLKINKQYLNHMSYTDIITFDNSVVPGVISADIYISIDRVRENAEKYQISFDEELHRVMVHGILHLLGYSDKTKRKKDRMTKKEDAYLSLR